MISRVSKASILQGFVKSRSFLAGNSAYTPPSFESIATANATGSTNFIDFTSIPSTFKHLQIRGIARDGVGYKMLMRLNSDTGANYANHILRGSGAAVAAGGSASATNIPVSDSFGTTANNFCAFIIDILDYGSTTKNKTVRVLSGLDLNGSGNICIHSGLWMNTSAITTIRLYDEDSATNIASSSTFALYGIKEA